MCTAELEACWELRGTTGVAASCIRCDSVMQRVPTLLQDTHSWRTVVTSPLNCCQPVFTAYPSAQEDHLWIQWRHHISPVITAENKATQALSVMASASLVAVTYADISEGEKCRCFFFFFFNSAVVIYLRTIQLKGARVHKHCVPFSVTSQQVPTWIVTNSW